MSKLVEAYVLITVETGSEYEVAERIKKLSNDVRDVLITYGIYDIVVKIETNSLDKLNQIVTKIRKIEGVKQTTTLVGIGV